MTGSAIVIEAGSDGRWVPLPLAAHGAPDRDGDLPARMAELATQALALRRPGVTFAEAETEVLEVAAMLTDVTRRVRDLADVVAGFESPVLTALAWALGPADRFTIQGIATLRVRDLPPPGTDDDAIKVVMDRDAEMFGEPAVEPLDTPSGRAFVLRDRPISTSSDGTREVHEQRVVVWPKPEHGVVVSLSISFVDLIEAGRYGPALDDLAQLLTMHFDPE